MLFRLENKELCNKYLETPGNTRFCKDPQATPCYYKTDSQT